MCSREVCHPLVVPSKQLLQTGRGLPCLEEPTPAPQNAASGGWAAGPGPTVSEPLATSCRLMRYLRSTNTLSRSGRASPSPPFPPFPEPTLGTRTGLRAPRMRLGLGKGHSPLGHLPVLPVAAQRMDWCTQLAGEGEGGTNWESSTDTWTPPCLK